MLPSSEAKKKKKTKRKKSVLDIYVRVQDVKDIPNTKPDAPMWDET